MKVSKNARTVLWLLALLPPLTQGQEYFSDCDVDYYYASLGLEDSSSWIKSALGELLKSTHRNHLPYTHSTKEDCWDSLIDLDKGSSSSTVHLIYKDVDVSSDSHGTSDTWNREHLWPKSLGVGTDGADMTDIHHLRPADWNVNAARGNKYFGECGIVRASSECASPAHAEAAASSAKDPEIWRPPTNVRGDIARAIFYMEARYYGEGTDPDLHLSDCPTGDLDMGYLSVLLQWHIEDPVSAEEVARNNRACERWQGNRNPFVDFPSLAAQFYGSPQTPVGDGQGYPTCQSPAATSPPITGCGGLSAGGVQIVAVSSDNPDVVALVALENLSAGLVLYRTDKAWMGSEFRSYEGIEQMTVPAGGIPAGTVFGFGETDWAQDTGTFSLSASGDSVLIYCQDNDSPIFLGGLIFQNPWQGAGASASTYGSRTSSLPSALAASSTELTDNYDNFWYTGPHVGTKANIVAAIADPANWQGSNTRPTYTPPTFTITNDSRRFLRGGEP